MKKTIKGINTAGQARTEVRLHPAPSAASRGVLNPSFPHSLDHVRASTYAISFRSSIKQLRIAALITAIIFSMAALSLTGCKTEAEEEEEEIESGNAGACTCIPVASVSLTKTSTTLLVNGTENLTATVAPSDATNQKVTWSSSAPSVASVSSGVVTGVSAGTTTITVTTIDGEKTAACSVTVSSTSVAVTDVSLNKTSAGLFVGGTETLLATITPSGATNQNISWSSSAPSVASVSSGVVTGVNFGTAIITVTTTDGGKTATCTVTVDGFSTIAAFKAWLDAQPTNTAATAYSVKLNVSDLGGDRYTASSAGNALYTNKNKYVNLDLSGSTFISIGNYAFGGCTSLTSVTIPNSVTSIHENAFGDCTSLTSINVDNANTVYSSENGVLYNKAKTTLIQYPEGKPGACTIPNSVTSI